MADPTFNLKTGADSDLYFAREVTAKGDKLGKIKTRDGIFQYPSLTRSTGNSIKGTTETIESNELRKGRTRGAPKQGNSSTSGSLDIEFSPVTYDDFLEAVFRGNWKRWKSDTESASNLDKNEFVDGYFATACSTSGARKLLDTDGSGTGDSKGLIQVPAGAIVHELTCGTEDIKYSILRHFGGVTGEDVYQEFIRMALSSLNISVNIGNIVTGSFGFMGVSDPKMMNTSEIKTEYGGTAATRFEDGETTGNKFIENLPGKSTQTDQFTAREGFLYINGKKIEYSSSLDLNLDNGLEQKSALFVKKPISTTPLSLDVTGTFKTYLISEESTKEFNAAVENKDVEILFCFQNKETDPDYIYVFQIFKSKLTDHDASVSGKDTLEISFPFTSFGEQAIRMFRIDLPKVSKVEITTSGDTYTGVDILPNIEVKDADLTGLSVTATLDGSSVTLAASASVDEDADNATYKHILRAFETPIAKTSSEQVLKVEATWNSETVTKTVVIPASA